MQPKDDKPSATDNDEIVTEEGPEEIDEESIPENEVADAIKALKE